MNGTTKFTVDPNEKWLYRLGGIAALVLGTGYLLTIPIFAYVKGLPPEGIDERLIYFAEYGTNWWMITGLMVFTDLLYVPIFLAIYQALKGINRYIILLAVACEGLFVALDLAITWTTYPALITLAGKYAAAASDVQRATYIAAAGYASAVADSPLSPIYAVFFPALGILLTSLIMRKGIFNKTTANVGLVAGVCGIIAGVGPLFLGPLEAVQVINSTLALIWFFIAGINLYRLGR